LFAAVVQHGFMVW